MMRHVPLAILTISTFSVKKRTDGQLKGLFLMSQGSSLETKAGPLV